MADVECERLNGTMGKDIEAEHVEVETQLQRDLTIAELQVRLVAH